MDNHAKQFQGGRDLKELVEAYELKLRIVVEEQIKFWQDFGIENADEIVRNIRESVDTAMLNYFITSRYFEDKAWNK